MSKEKSSSGAAVDSTDVAGQKGRARRYRVSLPHLAPLEIADCASEAEAYERYRKLHGVIVSDHEPCIEPLEGDDAHD